MRRAVLFSLVLLATGVALAETKFAKEEKHDLAQVAQEWIELGRFSVSKKLGEPAQLCLERAKAAAPDAKGLKALEESAAVASETPSEKDLKEWASREKATRKKVAALYERILAAGQGETDPKVQERLEGYFLEALALDPDQKRFARALALAEQAAQAKDAARAARIAERASALKPPEKLAPRFRALVDSLAIEKLVLKTASTHPLRYYLNLPRDYERKKGKKWPILLCVDGAGCNFEGIAAAYRDARQKAGLHYIVVSPCTFSNTNQIVGDAGMVAKYKTWYPDSVIEDGDKKRLEFDEPGILAALKDVAEAYDGEERVYATGFSGGGNATYMMIFKHPDQLVAAAPACANYSGAYEYSMKEKFPADEKRLLVHQITGEKDAYRQMIDAQTDAAAASLKELGYANTKRTLVPGMGHSGAVELVVATFKPYMEGKKARGDKPD